MNKLIIKNKGGVVGEEYRDIGRGFKEMSVLSSLPVAGSELAQGFIFWPSPLHPSLALNL